MISIALFSEHAKPTNPWQSMPALMLAKCAESQSLRKAFPNELSGLYSQEEIDSKTELKPSSEIVTVPSEVVNVISKVVEPLIAM